jgi:hypothetical protein
MGGMEISMPKFLVQVTRTVTYANQTGSVVIDAKNEAAAERKLNDLNEEEYLWDPVENYIQSSDNFRVESIELLDGQAAITKATSENGDDAQAQ